MKLELPLQEKIVVIFSYYLVILAKLHKLLQLIGGHSSTYLHNVQFTIFKIWIDRSVFLEKLFIYKSSLLGKTLVLTDKSFYQTE